MHGSRSLLVLGWVGCHLVDAAESLGLAGAPLHSDVPFLAPVRAPRVLHDDVVLVLGRPVPHRRHAMIQLRAARTVEHAAFVELEVPAGGLDGDADGLVRECLDQRLLVVGRHVLVPGDGDHLLAGGGGLVVAVALLHEVRVGLLRAQAAAAGDVGEGVVHDAAVAAVVAVGAAVDELLLRQRRQVPRHDGVDALHRRHRREGPAATALPLVLHLRHRSLLPPVHRLGHVVAAHAAVPEGAAAGAAVPAAAFGAAEAEVGGLELVVGEVGELVEAEPVAAHLLVDLVDVLEVVLEHLEPVQLLLEARVRLAVLGHPLLEQLDQPVMAAKVLLGVPHDGEVAVEPANLHSLHPRAAAQAHQEEDDAKGQLHRTRRSHLDQCLLLRLGRKEKEMLLLLDCEIKGHHACIYILISLI
uniref:Uncharacterized protein n=1 Tax=Arundo donax TaxID=35708 RepID=A0A0A8Y7N5_ARUDO